MKLLTEAQFRKNGQKVNEYIQNSIAQANDLAVEINKYWPCTVHYAHSEQDGGKLYFEYTEIQLKHPTLTLIINRRQGKQYSIHCRELTRTGDNWSHFKNISHYTVQQEKKQLKEPNGIGVLTKNKIQAWVTYYEQLYALLEPLDKENGNEKEQFLEAIKPFGPRFWNNGKNGEVIRNGIILKFEVSETYISKRIEIHWEVENELANFIKLSDNKYKQK